MTGRPSDGSRWPFATPASERPVQPGPVPSFSVVIPTYNAATTVARAVQSALAQTVTPLEVLVVDDGSTDDTAAALTPFDTEITIIRKRNGGGASALDVGLRAASGDFVAVLDADDAYERERLEALAELGAARPDLDLLATDVSFEVDGKLTGRFSAGTPFASHDQRTAIFERCFVCAPAVRRERVLAIGGYDEKFRIAYDWDCYLRLILAGGQAGLVDVPLYRYRITGESLTGNRPAALRERVTMLEKARANPAVKAEELGALDRALAANTRRALLWDVDASLRHGGLRPRRSAMSIVVGDGFGARTRLKALAAAVVPSSVWPRIDLAGRDGDGPPMTPSHPR